MNESNESNEFHETLDTLRARCAASSGFGVGRDWRELGLALRAAALPGPHYLPLHAEALDALLQASANDGLLGIEDFAATAQSAFIVKDWACVEAFTDVLLQNRHTAGSMLADALVWRAAVHQSRDDFDEAERLLGKAVAVLPDNPIALHKLALCIKEQARFDEAEALLRRALKLDPDSAAAQFDLSELEIRAERFADGWPRYEARVAFDEQPGNAQAVLSKIAPHWQGEPLTGKTLVVYGEQGHGDCLWAVRFLPLLAERARREGARVIFGHDGPLRHLFERMLPAGITLETGLDTQPDFHCGLMSLPLRLGIVDSAGWGRAYLTADAARTAVWRERVAQARGRKRAVGIVWNGNPAHVRDIRRSVPVDQLAPLLTVPGLVWFALSPGRGETVAHWQARGIDIVDPTVQFDAGFDDVAALMANLDLVVTIDSGPAHLAGALGVPTCLLIDHVSAWFWGNRQRVTPWYDAVELFRQPSIGAWAPALSAVRERLEALVSRGT
ncbi:tetratricopeptide repeat-containing glycosyltransferase family protein [Paraburkholderia sp.]|uniref:tetratricopeptide repeat-containing glycosyltransferase family protein n=1 Tax=Paraburkholderia sp. TaxID=1926495 RepID=UPI00239F6FB6|nr:tetratricopeptide repeat-containing glycosyltransferase family protein [Paraburkholderia sp.]MDE1183810.1 tetratricopeptide repeat-containing glycosyltransferase family protein [Paraburkholderia sp.]